MDWTLLGTRSGGFQERVSDPSSAGLPLLDILSEPKSDAPTTQIDNGPREVLIATEVRRHGVVVAQPQNRGDIRRADQILGVHLRGHAMRLHTLTSLEPHI